MANFASKMYDYHALNVAALQNKEALFISQRNFSGKVIWYLSLHGMEGLTDKVYTHQ